MHSQSSVSQLDEQLSAYFDGELGDSELGDEQLGATLRALVDGEPEQDQELAARLGDLSFMRTMIVGALEHQAERVPEARFEQIWDSFEQTLERESRLQEAAEAPPSLWQRLSAWARPLRLPLAVVGAAGALVLVFARSAGAPTDDLEQGVATAPTASNTDSNTGSNTQAEGASEAQPTPASPQLAPVQPSRVAIAPEAPSPEIAPEMFPKPEPGEAEIRRIEFGGHTGTISQVEGSRGTTTVIWVTDDDDPVDSERSL